MTYNYKQISLAGDIQQQLLSMEWDDCFEDNGVLLELQGTGNNLDPWRNHVSASRATMMSSSHLPQAPIIKHTTPRKCSTGLEEEYGKYTTAIKMPADGTVIKNIPKYELTYGGQTGAIRHIPSELMLYDNVETGEIGVLELTTVRSDHVTFGYKYCYRDVPRNKDSNLAKGTIIASSSSLKTNGSYEMGVEANVVFMSHPACIEDGIVITNEFARKLVTTNVMNRTLQFDETSIPLNLYGDKENYRIHPDIGEEVRDDGVLYATRRVCSVFGFLEITKSALSKIKPGDRACYVQRKSVVNDITARTGKKKKRQLLPEVVTRQVDMYVEYFKDYNRRIREEEQRIIRLRGNGVPLSGELHTIFKDARATDPNAVKHRVNLIYRKTPLKAYDVEFEVIYDLHARVGHKLTDLHGGKAVAVAVIPAEDAPVDAYGTVADIIIDGTTCNDRINPGRLFEQLINAHSDQIIRLIKRTTDVELQFTILLNYYSKVSLPMAKATAEAYTTVMQKAQHVNYVISKGIHWWLPPNTKDLGLQQVLNMEEFYPLQYGPVKYRDLAGNIVYTNSSMFIGSIYIIMLEKIGADWSAVAVSKQQHFGFPAKLSAADKYLDPVRKQSVRILDESTVRLLSSVLGGDMVSRMLLLASSPTVIRDTTMRILTADKPGALKDAGLVKTPVTDNRAVQYTKHLLYCYGAKTSTGGRLTGGQEDLLEQVEVSNWANPIKFEL